LRSTPLLCTDMKFLSPIKWNCENTTKKNRLESLDVLCVSIAWLHVDTLHVTQFLPLCAKERPLAAKTVPRITPSCVKYISTLYILIPPRAPAPMLSHSSSSLPPLMRLPSIRVMPHYQAVLRITKNIDNCDLFFCASGGLIVLEVTGEPSQVTQGNDDVNKDKLHLIGPVWTRVYL
jgi:hypothetical protein